jgi:hypothetical protein
MSNAMYKYALAAAALAVSACAADVLPQPDLSIPIRVEHLGQIPEPAPRIIYRTKTKVVRVEVPASTPSHEPNSTQNPQSSKKHWWQKKHHWWE